MRKYSWDFNYLMNLQNSYKVKLLNSNSDEEKQIFNDVIDQLSIMMYTIITSEGVVINEKIRHQFLLDSFREQKSVEDYSALTDSLISDTLPLIAELEPIRNIKYKSNIEMDECIEVLGDAIKEVFGDKHYQIYLDYIKNRSGVIQLSNVVDSAYTTTIHVDDHDEHFMLLPRTNNFHMFSDFIHEVGHLYRMVNNEYNPLLDDKLYEFEAYYYQVKILEYFIENNIYVKESIVALLEIFKSIERVAVLIDADKKFDLHSNFNIGNFKDLCAKIDLYDRANIPNTLNLLEYLSYVYSRNILNYIYSVLAVIEVKDRSDSRDIYEYITHNIGSVSSDEYVYKIFDDPITFNGLDKYKKFRGKILELSKNI